MATYYQFGVEIEIIADPHKVRNPLDRALYYDKLAKALRNRGLRAKADDLSGEYRKHPEHYSRWFITKDGSLERPDHPGIALEAVSPILSTHTDWETQVDAFWDAQKAVFHMPKRSPLCGSHIHITPAGRKKWSTEELRTLALGIVYYEDRVQKMLPVGRRDNSYCQRNTVNSDLLRGRSLQQIVAAVAGSGRSQLIRLMQKDRRVLWNFDHAADNESGTIEFRGGRCLRGPVRTKRWIAFAVSYMDFLLRRALSAGNAFPAKPDVQALYQEIRRCARNLGLAQYLPEDYRILNESRREHDSEDDGSESGVFDISPVVARVATCLKKGRGSGETHARTAASDYLDVSSVVSRVTSSSRNVLRKRTRARR